MSPKLLMLVASFLLASCGSTIPPSASTPIPPLPASLTTDPPAFRSLKSLRSSQKTPAPAGNGENKPSR